MTKRKAERVGQGIGIIIGLALMAALLAAAVLPLFLLCRYLKYRYLSYKQRKGWDLSGYGWWLTIEEQNSFKESHASEIARRARNLQENEALENLIAHEQQRALEAGIATNMDGSYSRRSYLGKEIQDKLDELEGFRRKLDLNDYAVSCRQPRVFWNELNDLLKKQDVAFVALLGWACGAFFFYSAYQQGAPFGLWIDLFVPALCAGVGASLAALFSRRPAIRYLPKPVKITIENVDSPEAELPQRRRFGLKLVGVCVWLGIMVIAGAEGRQYGAKEAFAYRERIAQENALAARQQRIAENEMTLEEKLTARQSSNRSIAPSGSEGLEEDRLHAQASVVEITGQTLARLSADQVERLILTIYARSGVEFESVSAQTWADQQSWYRRVPGKTIRDAEREFSLVSRRNVARLVSRWNQLREEQGLAPISMNESPLAGRAVSPDIEGERFERAAPALKALSVIEGPSPAVLGNLHQEQIKGWGLARVRLEINSIYARHGVDFTNRELKTWADKQPDYKCVPGRTFADAEALFSDTDRRNIELLAERRSQINSGAR